MHNFQEKALFLYGDLCSTIFHICISVPLTLFRMRVSKKSFAPLAVFPLYFLQTLEVAPKTF